MEVGRAGGQGSPDCGGIRRSHNEMDGYAKEREIYSVPIRKDGKTFVIVEKKGACQRG